VVIVDHGSLGWESLPQWYLEQEPELTVGVLEGDEVYQFFGVVDAHRRRDGSLAVIDRSRTIRVFDSGGAHMWTAGREGDGPGEFRWPQMVTEIGGDSLLVWDPAANRLTVFAPEGLLARTSTLHEFAGSDRSWGLSGPDRLLMEHRDFERALIDGRDAFTYHVDLFRVDLGGQIVDRLGRWFFAREYQEVDSRGAFSPAIFATPAVFAPAFDGFWYGDTESYELRRVTAAAGIERILRWRGPDQEIMDSDVEALFQVWRASPGASPDLEHFLREYGRTHPKADQFPSYEEILTDAVGRVWVRDFVREHADDGFRYWTVFSPDGTQVLGRLTHSEKVKPLDVGDDWILGVETDALDVERLVFHRIVR